MDEPRPDKVAVVTEVKERLAGSPSVLVTEYRGLSVKALAELRRNLRPVGGKYKIYKNTLVRRAAAEAGLEIEEHLLGPTALTFTEQTPEGETGDIVTVAKVLTDFAKTNPDLVIKGGLLDGAPVGPDDVKKLANIEPREVLLARLAGAMAAPTTQLAGLLQALPRNFAYGLKALIDQGGAPGAPASAEAPEAEETGSTETGTDESPSEDAAVAEATSSDEARPEADGDTDTETNDAAEEATTDGED